MPQIIPSTNDLIIDSLMLIGELGVGEIPDARILTVGLRIINELLDKFSSDSIYVPYLTTINFNFVVGKDTYSISDIFPADITEDRLIDLQFANYIVEPLASEPIVYPLRIINKATYNNVVRLQNLLTRPGFIFLNKQPLESFVTVYPTPDQPYPCILQAKVMLNSVAANEDLLNIPPYYYGFLKYAMGRKFLGYYPSANWPQSNEDEYQDYFNNLKNSNETDLTIRPSVTMTAPEPFYWPNILAY